MRAAVGCRRDRNLTTKPRIGVVPRSAALRLPGLLEALASVVPVVLEPRDESELDGLDAVIFLDDVPASHTRGLRALVVRPGETTGAEVVTFGDSPVLDSRLRGQSFGGLDEVRILAPSVRGTVLARCDSGALWVRAGDAEFVVGTVEELELRDTLRSRLTPSSCFPLLPLVHFLRDVAGGSLFHAPALRAAFVVDDPNLHAASYGFIPAFEQLACHAHAHRYHAAIALIPLDTWWNSRRAVEAFTAHSELLSLVMHGNNHVKRELARGQAPAERLRMLAQAMRRVWSFERRTGLRVAKIMIPPHGECSEETMHDLLRLGYEAACISRPYPWLERPPAGHPLAGWHPADFVAGGLPVLGRYAVTRPREELVLRAFLGQPLILYGHHRDLRSRFRQLATTASFVNGLGNVTWMSLGEIARSNYMWRREGSRLHVRPYARILEVDVPAGVERLLVEPPESHLRPQAEQVECGGETVRFLEDVAVVPGRVTVRLRHDSAVDPLDVPRPRPALWPYVRRAATEARDRLQPVGRSHS